MTKPTSTHMHTHLRSSITLSLSKSHKKFHQFFETHKIIHSSLIEVTLQICRIVGEVGRKKMKAFKVVTIFVAFSLSVTSSFSRFIPFYISLHHALSLFLSSSVPLSLPLPFNLFLFLFFFVFIFYLFLCILLSLTHSPVSLCPSLPPFPSLYLYL